MPDLAESINPPLSPAQEMGRRGGLARARKLSAARRKEISQQGSIEARQHFTGALREIEDLLVSKGIVPFRRFRKITNPEAYINLEWTSRLPKEWEQLLDVAKAAADWELATRILTAMTALTRLAPSRLKQIADDSDIPTEAIDLSSLDHAALEKLSGKPVSSMTPVSDDDDGRVSGLGKPRPPRTCKQTPKT